MKKISFDQFKIIYKKYYAQIVDILVKNKVYFSCACGTMLGAIREKDMIAWDYDIDNFFFIEDINNLLSIQDQLPQNFYFETYLDEKLRYGLVRIICKDLYRHDVKSTKYINVRIDFFAIRNVKIKANIQKRVYQNVLKEEKKILFKECRYKSRNFVRGAIKNLYKLFLPSAKFSSRKIKRKVEKLKDGTTCIMCRNFRLVSTTPINKKRIIFIDFGEYKIPCFENYNEILSCLFGENWMTPVVYNDREIPEFYLK